MVLRVGLIGLGVMGSNHARIIHESKRAELAKVFDANSAVCDQVARNWGAVAARSIEDVEDCDAIVVASSTASHDPLARHFAALGKPMLIEKPLCSTLDETRDLIALCDSENIPLVCGFVERFNPAVVTALKMIDGPVRHLSTYRHSPFNSRASSGVVTDLLIHDLDLTARLAPSNVTPSVGASLWAPNDRGYVETADCTLQFGSHMTSVQSASRWGQRKIREMRISTDDLLLELDLLRVTVTAYRHRSQGGGNEGETMTYRSETMIEVPFVRHAGEPLALQFDHFADLVSGEADTKAELATLEAPHRLAHEIEKSAGQSKS
jgi:predicted dehydrogenase